MCDSDWHSHMMATSIQHEGDQYSCMMAMGIQHEGDWCTGGNTFPYLTLYVQYHCLQLYCLP